MSIMDYMIGANLGKAQGEAIERSRANSLQGQLDIVETSRKGWMARYEREKAARRGWQEEGMAARELIQKLTGTDKAGAEKLIGESYKLHQTKIDASIASVDNTLFHGKTQQ